MFNIPSWSKTKDVCYIHTRQSSRLLVTVGDSWTFGDSLGKTKVRDGIDDRSHRLKAVYGWIMSEAMACDWVNLALPGGSNTLVLSWLEILLGKMYKDYEEVICVVTLTESGRHEDMQYINRQLTHQQNLERMVTLAYGQIQTIALKYPTVRFIIAHNFTDPVGITPCNQSWLEVMLGKQISNGTHQVVSEHIEQMNYDARFPDVIEILNKAEARIDLLDSCNFCHKEDSRHPNERGHEMWARYLLSQIWNNQ